MNRSVFRIIIFNALFFIVLSGIAQDKHERRFNVVYPYSTRVYDSLTAMRIPVLEVPASKLRTDLPSSVDNTTNEFWPGYLDQCQFYSCQQYAGVAYTFGYEYNRLRNTPGWYWENRFGAHYTWNFLNEGGQYIGVNFLHSFDVIRQQGHMTNDYFGSDTAGSYLGWKTGYDKYYEAMFHRLKKVSAIQINSATGVNTLRNYLYDHLDGSAVGGIACFTTESAFDFGTLPPGTPEAGKSVQRWWYSLPDHGLCIVGYNDSIRYDINGDGLYTNNIDINNDGIVDVRDWEIGGFKFANSWGTWWGNDGSAYVLYRAMGSNFEDGGVWNNRVYVVEADTGYHPILTMKVKINYNKRQRIRLIAGVSSTPASQFPEHTMSFPIVNFQGGDHVMNGFDYGPGSKAVELGLDITPLLNWFPGNGQAKIFLGVEERDADHSGTGTIEEASFISYAQGQEEFVATSTPVAILDNNLTLVSAMVTAGTSKVQITTESLPPYIPGQHYEQQLQAEQGTVPYTWSLRENYAKQPFSAALPANTGTKLTKISDLRPYTVKALPFSFPWYGTMHDSIYINFNGFVSFGPQDLPAPYITDELAMMRMFALMSPAFSQQYTYVQSKNDGVFYQAWEDKAIIWWKTSVIYHESISNNNFAVILYPDGRFEFRYGTMNTAPILPTIYTGISKGDVQDFDIQAQWRADTLSGNAVRYLASPKPKGIHLTKEGLLAVTDIDSTQIYSIPVVVTDEENLTDNRMLALSVGLMMTEDVICGEDNRFQYGIPAQLKLTLENTGQTAIGDLEVHLSSTDSSCVVTDSLIMVTILNPGEPIILEPVFNFMLTGRLPADYPVRLNLQARSGSRVWNQSLDIPVSVSINQPWVVFQSVDVHDANGKLETGETAPLNITLANIGDQPASNVMVTLSCQSPYINLIDSTAYFGNFTPGGLVTIIDAFSIEATMDIPNGTDILFTVAATDGNLTWTSPFAIKPYAPAFTVGGMIVVDGSGDGNGNGILDPGETADLLIATTNSGGYVADNTVGNLSCSSPYITIGQGSNNLGPIAVGETVNAQFTVTVSPDAPLNTPVEFLYTVESGLYHAQKTFTPKIGLVVEDFESGDFTQFPWVFSGNSPWVISNIQPYEGIYSAKSGAIAANQTSALILQREVAIPDTISFYLKTSSEAGYDYLKFYIDGNNVAQWAGETPWIRAAFYIPAGNHTFTWGYSKDSNTSNGSDCAWVDYIVLPATTETGVNVSGTITYANSVNTPLSGVTITLLDQEGTAIHTTTTSASGNYIFTSVPPGNYTFGVTTVKPWDGVTAADMLLYRKHIANISYLNGIHLASGDVNLSGTLTAADVLLIQKRIANITNSFASGDWLFDPDPFIVGAGNMIEDFNGIIYGDANGSYTPSASKLVIPTRGTLTLGSVSTTKQEILVPIQIADIEDLGAFQFSLHYNAQKLKLKDITNWMPGIEEVTTGTPAPGAITFVWSAITKGITIPEGILCNLHFQVLSNGESPLSFYDNPTAIEFTGFDGDNFMPELSGGMVKSTNGLNIHNEEEVILYPNPNNGKFYLYFDKPKMFNSMKVINALGVTVYEERNIQTTESQIKVLNLTDRPDGIYTLILNDGENAIAKKIMIRR
ncbi:MAG: carboxypeptidase regulatory-like domain-containing protein [Bacteroidales bacterium]|nr:carboxypeptidase regulatory-like domain-containing protein [Bacteroidales bacterium]